MKKGTSPLDIASALFTDKGMIYELTYESARQSLFIVLRRLAIMYPEQANLFNKPKVNPLECIRFWSDYLYKDGGRVPSWMYVSGSVKSSSEKDSKRSFTKQELTEYMNRFNVTHKQFEDCMHFFPDETSAEVRDYSDYIKKLKSSSYEQQE